MTDPVQLGTVLGTVLDTVLVPPCVVRDYEITGKHVSGPMSPPCPHPAAFEALCRFCGHGGPTCAQHEAEIMVDPRCMCGTCRAAAVGAELYAFIPLG